VLAAADVKVEQTTGLPMLTIHIDREKKPRVWGSMLATCKKRSAIAVGGREAGVLFEGDRRFDIMVRLPETLRSNLDALRRLPLRLPSKRMWMARVPICSLVT
jgi:cobalt-zinc-cadmium resistance protein CzcA